MRKRIGTKIYDTEKAELIDTLPDGIQVYRKTGRSSEVFLYNPNGKNKHEMFFDLPEEQAAKYTQVKTGSGVYRSNRKVEFSPDDINRLKSHAYSQGMSIRQYIMMLVDRYEQEQE